MSAAAAATADGVRAMSWKRSRRVLMSSAVEVVPEDAAGRWLILISLLTLKPLAPCLRRPTQQSEANSLIVVRLLSQYRNGVVLTNHRFCCHQKRSGRIPPRNHYVRSGTDSANKKILARLARTIFGILKSFEEHEDSILLTEASTLLDNHNNTSTSCLLRLLCPVVANVQTPEVSSVVLAASHYY